MNELNAVFGVLLITAVAFAGYLAVNDSLAGAAIAPYQSCCCTILAGHQWEDRAVVRSQIQTYANNCADACVRYRDYGNTVFPQKGLCADNP